MSRGNRTSNRTVSQQQQPAEDTEEQPATLPMPSAEEAPPTHEQDPFLTPAEVARQLGMSPQTIGRWIQDGLINATFFPNERWKVRKSEVNRLLRGSCLNKQVV